MNPSPVLVRRSLLVCVVLAGTVAYGFSAGRSGPALVAGLSLLVFLLVVDWFLNRDHAGRHLGWVLGSAVGLLVGVYLLNSFRSGTVYPRDPVVWIVLGTGLYLGGLAGARSATWFPGSSRNNVPRSNPDILDTSVLIDGRVVELMEAGFLEGSIRVPRFVVRELQTLADSEDRMKRSRGRRGLEVLNRLREDTPGSVEVADWRFPGVEPVDEQLVEAALRERGRLVTNDFNLSQVARARDVTVLNLNELNNALKMEFIPGETLQLEILRRGEEPDQGVGFLEDGTMVVVEGAGDRVGEQLDITVTSVIQTDAGRMVFAEPSPGD